MGDPHERQRYFSPEINAAHPTPTCIVIPPTDELTYYKWLHKFNPAETRTALEQNIKIINELNPHSLDQEDQMLFSRIRFLLNRTWLRYHDKLYEISKSYCAGLDIYDFLINENVAFQPNISAPFYHDIERSKVPHLIAHELGHIQGPTTVLSETHSTTFDLLKEVKKHNSDAKIGMVIFDTHVDTVRSNRRGKWNVVEQLVTKRRGEERLVDQIVVIGQPDELYVRGVGQQSDPNSKRFQGRIQVVTEEDLYDPESVSLRFSESQMQKIITSQISKFAKNGITNVMISFDIDELNSNFVDYTAMEYNPLHALLFFARLELSANRDNVDRVFLSLTQDTEAPYSYTILAEPTLVGGRGLSVEYAGVGIHSVQKNCKIYGIQYGAQVYNAQVLGDIVEYEGPDYHDLTKKAVLSIAKSMYPI